MLKRWIAFSLDHAVLIIALSVAAVGWVLAELPRRSMDVFPEVDSPTVVVLSECAGLAPEEVEQFVTLPIEAAVQGLPEVMVVRSGSSLGFSMVTVQFEWGADIYRARQLVDEALNTVRERLPSESHTELSPITGILGEISLISVSADPEAPASATALREYAQFDLAPRLLSVQGVSQVVTLGGELPEYQVRVDPERLRLLDVDLAAVHEAAERASSIRGAGYLPDVEGREMSLRQSGQVDSARELARTVVEIRGERAITLGDVATVEKTAAPQRGTAAEGGRAAVVLGVKKAPGTNTLEVTRRVDEALAAAGAILPEGMRLNPRVMRQADFIQRSLDNVREVLRDAAIFVALVLMLFLMNVRAFAITLTALPLSLAMAIGVLWVTGLGLNVMTLGGLAVALGEVVDDAIIDVENVFRRLRDNRALPEEQRKSLRDVVFSASNEIRSAVVFATAILGLVVAPLLFLEGLEGRFFRPMALAYMAALGASLVVALSLTPVLCKLLLRREWRPDRGKPRAHGGKSLVVRWLERVYRPTLGRCLRWRGPVVAAALLLALGALLLASTFGTSFLPEFNEGTYTVFLFAPPGTSLVESDRLARSVERQLIDVPGVAAVVRRTGRAENDAHAEPVSSSEIEVRLEEDAEAETVLAAVDEVLESVPGISTQVGQPISHRLSHVLSGTLAAIAVDLVGDDGALLRQLAEEVAESLRDIPDVRDVALPREALVESVEVRYRADDLARWGLTRAEAAAQVGKAYSGHVAGRVYEGLRIRDVVVRFPESLRDSVDDVRRLPLRARDGRWLRLHEVADVGPVSGPMAIQHEALRRKATVSCNVAPGGDLGGIAREIQRRAEAIAHPQGVSVRLGGQHEAQQRAARRLLWGGLAVGVLIFLLLTTVLRSAKAAGVVLVNLPLGMIGGVMAIYLVESESVAQTTQALIGLGGRYRPPVVSIASLVGFLTLFGISVRGGILLVQRIRVLEDQGRGVEGAIRQGSEERLVPILMTAITAMLGLLPIALARGEPGSELLAPLAVVVLGGLGSATLLNLMVVPAAYSLVFDRGREGGGPVSPESVRGPSPRDPGQFGAAGLSPPPAVEGAVAPESPSAFSGERDPDPPGPESVEEFLAPEEPEAAEEEEERE